MQRILVVDAPEDLQVERVRARSGLSDKEIRSIIGQQAPITPLRSISSASPPAVGKTRTGVP